MASIEKGILGPVGGKVGTVVGSSWKGINYIKSTSGKRSGKSSVKQIEQQLRFALMVDFLQTMTAIFDRTFKKYAVEMSGFNAAVSYNVQNAVAGASPDFEVDYEKALISRGALPNATAPSASVTENAVFFTWTDNSSPEYAAETDVSVLVAYCKEMDTSIFIQKGPIRSAGGGQLDVTNFAGKTIQTWIAFVSEDEESSSNSIYTGELSVG